MTIKIRTATLKDLTQLRDFEQGVVAAERPFNSSLKDSKVEYYDIERLIADSNTHLVVAEEGKQIVGCGYAQLRPSKAHLKHSHHAYMGFMYVAPSHRRLGINRLIIEALFAWSKGQGVVDAYLDVYHDNKAAVSAYESLGFSRSLIEMKLQL